MTKAQVIEIINTLPDQFEVEKFSERLLFVQQLQERLAESDNDQVVSLAGVRQWLTQLPQRAA